MAGYHPKIARGKNVTSGDGGKKLPKATKANIEYELSNAAFERARANSKLYANDKADGLTDNPSLKAKKYATDAKQMASKAAKKEIAKSAAKGTVNIAKGAAGSTVRAFDSYLQTSENNNDVESAKQAAKSLSRDAGRGVLSTASSGGHGAYSAIRDDIRVRRSARRILRHKKGVEDFDPKKAPKRTLKGINAKARKGLPGVVSRKRAQRASARFLAWQFNTIKANPRYGLFGRPGRIIRNVFNAPLKVFRGVNTVRRVALAPIALITSFGTLALALPLFGFILFGSVSVAAIDPRNTNGGSYRATKYVEQAKAFAADDSIGYNRNPRLRLHNPDMDCSAFVWFSLVDSGAFSEKDLGPVTGFASYTMGEKLKAAGFEEISVKGLNMPADLKYGDILQRNGHTEIYIGDGKNAGAWSNYDGVPGDSSGREVWITRFWNDSWEHIYRLPESANVQASPDAAGIWSWLRANGYSEAASAAVMGNAYAESGLNPSAIQPGNYAAGLFQWESYKNQSARWKELDSYARSQGKEWTDVTCQLEFMDKELQQVLSPSGYVEFKLSTDVNAATITFCDKFERPSVHVHERRVGAANQYLSEFGGAS